MLAPLVFVVADDVALPATRLRILVVAAPVLSPAVPVEIDIPPARANDDVAPGDSLALVDSAELPAEPTASTSR